MKKIVIISGICILIAMLIIDITFFKAPTKNYNILVNNFQIVNNEIEIYLKPINTKIWCLNSEIEIIAEAKDDWILAKNNKCLVPFFKDNNYIYVKNEKNRVSLLKDFNKLNRISKFEISDSILYLAVNGKQKINVDFDYLGTLKNPLKYQVLNENIASTNENIVVGISPGTTKIIITLEDQIKEIEVVVTKLINALPRDYKQYKDKLVCNQYSSEENQLLDKILENRVLKAGYQTRAGVLAAARFLMYEFPNFISYSSENGRVNNFGDKAYVDGEGRYYHKGLYLSTDKFKDIKSSMHGPATWGCPLYFISMEEKTRNGLDCSGFVSWTLLNGGFDVGDLGSGIADEWQDLTDYGTKTDLTSDLIASKNIKAGDLIGYDGHIAIIIGIDDENTYVAEALWFGENRVEVRSYSKSWLLEKFDYVMLMDSYYKSDGNYTAMWY